LRKKPASSAVWLLENLQTKSEVIYVDGGLTSSHPAISSFYVRSSKLKTRLVENEAGMMKGEEAEKRNIWEDYPRLTSSLVFMMMRLSIIGKA
jgi:hypothetical protein